MTKSTANKKKKKKVKKKKNKTTKGGFFYAFYSIVNVFSILSAFTFFFLSSDKAKTCHLSNSVIVVK